MGRTRRFSLRALLVITAGVAWVLAAALNCLGPIRPHSTIARIQNGMTQSEVGQILGPPDGNTSSNSWSYERFMTPGWLVVHFDESGRVEDVDHEPPFP